MMDEAAVEVDMGVVEGTIPVSGIDEDKELNVLSAQTEVSPLEVQTKEGAQSILDWQGILRPALQVWLGVQI